MPSPFRARATRRLRRTLGRGLVAFALVAFGLALAGCDESFLDSGAVVDCREVGVQCRLAEGPLGVCERAPCAEGRDGPCFACTPQH